MSHKWRDGCTCYVQRTTWINKFDEFIFDSGDCPTDTDYRGWLAAFTRWSYSRVFCFLQKCRIRIRFRGVGHEIRNHVLEYIYWQLSRVDCHPNNVAKVRGRSRSSQLTIASDDDLWLEKIPSYKVSPSLSLCLSLCLLTLMEILHY